MEYINHCKMLISTLKNKFDYELNSNVYQVSALLNTSMLKHWYFRPDTKNLVSDLIIKIFAL